MRNFSIFTLFLSVFFLIGCQQPESKIHYSALENLPPKTLEQYKQGGLTVWALASSKGNVLFYLLPPQGAIPERLSVRMGKQSLPVTVRQELGRVYYEWEAELGQEGITKAAFAEVMFIDAHFVGGKKACLHVPGLGVDSYPVLNMCYFDLPWELIPCP